MDIESLFQPDGIQLFLNEALGRNALHIQGYPGKFQDVMSWSTVNRLLAYGGLSYPRLRVIRGEQELSPDIYYHVGLSGYPQLLVAELSAALRDGALLAIDAIDQLDEAVCKLCRAIEKILGLPVGAELYGSWPASIPRRPQWDDHETLILQVDGAKSWSLYQPTVYHPTAGMELIEPHESPRWNDVIGAGDLLYIPRGWWYKDDSLTAPALYLAVTFLNPRGSDVVSRLAGILKNKDLFRMDIPRFRTADHQSRYITALQQEVNSAIAMPGIFGVLDDIQETIAPLVEFNLPWSVQPNPRSLSRDHQLIMLSSLSSIEALTRRRDDEWVEIPHNGRLLRFDSEAICILERLCRLPLPTVNDLLKDCLPYISEELILDYVSDLAAKGIVCLTAPT